MEVYYFYSSPEKIENALYKGEWSPRKIKNPEFFMLESAEITPIGAIGFEIWTMNDGILFDNIYVGDSIADAEKLAVEQWQVKFNTEKASVAEETKAEEKSEKVSKNKFTDQLKDELNYFFVAFQKSPIDALKSFPLIVSAIVSALFVLVTLCLTLFKSVPKKVLLIYLKGSKKTDDIQEDEHLSEAEEEEEVEEKDETVEDEPTTTKRKSKRTEKVENDSE